MTRQTLIILQKSDNPTTDFFIRSRFSDAEFDIEIVNLADRPSVAELEGAVVVVVRYLSFSWRRIIEAHRVRLAGLYYFMDDDVLDWHAHSNQRWRYRLKLYLLAGFHQAWLVKMQAAIRVSSPYLADKYENLNPQVWLPLCIYDKFPGSLVLGDAPVVFYHGTLSHFDEIRWLVPVIQSVLEAHPTVRFELVGDQSVAALLDDLSRVDLVPQMDWQAYKGFIRKPGRAIGLAPLLDTPFNRARSATKFFDITAAGAVGVYADCHVYQARIKHDQNGLLLPMDQDIWVGEILNLLNNAERADDMYQSAVQACTLSI